MSSRIWEWLKKEIKPLRKRATPSPFARKIGRVFQIVTLLGLCTVVVWRVYLYLDINSRFSQIRAAGFPASGAELNLWRHAVPEADNGALVLTQAFALRWTFHDGRSNEVMRIKVLGRTNDWSPAMWELVEAYVQSNSLAVAKVQEALQLSQFRFPVDFSYGPDIELPHLGNLKELARMAAFQTALDVHGGSREEWPKHVEVQLELAGTLDDEPILISHLVRNAIVRMAVQATERSLNRVTPNDDACKRLQSAFAHVGETNLLPAALVGERAMMIPAFRLSWKEIQSSSQRDEPASQSRTPHRYSGKPATFLWFTGFFERDLDFFLATMEKCISLARMPFPERLDLTNYFETACTTAQKRAYFLSEMLLPSLSRVVVRDASNQALVELATCALAVERFRLAEGRLPTSLKELTPRFLDAVPIDPFDGNPVRYRRLSSGYVIYSVDSDGHDDGGLEPPERKKATDKDSYDITFIVER
ncbi:MAG TPA: hypothetical protein VKY92_25675 [Verrucomicrobiae bacterium]|nr:hypothetical protein [Verrucomicrobiae bacterium]